MSLDALEVSVQLARSLRHVVCGIRRQDVDLAAQLKRSVSSIALNIAEAARREGRDRVHHFRVAAGSAGESATALRLAEAWGYVDSTRTDEPLQLLDRILAML